MKLRSVFSISHKNMLRGYVTNIPLVYSTLVPIQTINLNNVVFDIYSTNGICKYYREYI